MKIGIIGAGSIGLLFAGYLAKNNDVTVFPRTKEQAQLITKKGVTVIDKNSNWNIKVRGTNKTSELRNQDLIIIAVKQYDLDNVILHEDILPQIPLLFLQNGMSHLSILKNLKNDDIYLGSVEHGALRISDTEVRHNGMGMTNVSVYKGSHQVLNTLLERNDATFPFHFTKDYEQTLTKKLIVNAMINPLTAILNVKNGELTTNNDFFHIFLELYKEIIPLFPLLNDKTMLNEVIGICKNTKENESSMLKDIKAGNKTEIDAIIGVILSRAEDNNVELPISWTLYQMIKGMERKEGGC